MTCVLCGRSKLTSLDFSVGLGIKLFSGWMVETHLVLVPEHLSLRNFRGGIEIDLIPVLASRLNLFLCGGSNLTWKLCAWS